MSGNMKGEMEKLAGNILGLEVQVYEEEERRAALKSAASLELAREIMEALNGGSIGEYTEKMTLQEWLLIVDGLCGVR